MDKYYRIIKNQTVRLFLVDNCLKSSIIIVCKFVIMHKECHSTEGRKIGLKKNHNNVAKALAMFVQVTITMLSPLLLCGWIGLWLNETFHTTIWFLVMMGLGVLAAFRNFYHLVRGFYEKDLERENAQREYFDSMKRERERRRNEEKRK